MGTYQVADTWSVHLQEATNQCYLSHTDVSFSPSFFLSLESMKNGSSGEDLNNNSYQNNNDNINKKEEEKKNNLHVLIGVLDHSASLRTSSLVSIKYAIIKNPKKSSTWFYAYKQLEFQWEKNLLLVS